MHIADLYCGPCLETAAKKKRLGGYRPCMVPPRHSLTHLAKECSRAVFSLLSLYLYTNASSLLVWLVPSFFCFPSNKNTPLASTPLVDFHPAFFERVKFPSKEVKKGNQTKTRKV
jgi:hypothetical protein